MYITSDFDIKNTPKTPEYSQLENWAVLPDQWPIELEGVLENSGTKTADVFYIYPTLFTNKKNPQWNADIYTNEIRKEVLSKAVGFQASAWADAANLYVPFYRQAHYRIFVDPYAAQGKEAGVLAYQDVKRAFQFYLENYNQGKPIIITETGWPSEGGSYKAALADDAAAMKYFIDTVNWTKENEIPIFYFSSFDESWKTGDEGDVGAYWGLWDKYEKLKYS